MVKVNVNLKIFLIFSISKKNMELQLGKRLYTSFHTGIIESCRYLAPKKKLIYNKLIWYFMYLYLSFLGVAYRHKLKHSLLDVPRKIVLLKFENMKRDEWSWLKLLKIRLLRFYLLLHMKSFASILPSF